MPDILSQLTIVVPTYKRHENLAKLLRYYADLPVRMIVVDGSPEPFGGLPPAGQALQLRYHHMPVSIEERIRFAAGECDSPYAMFSCDDEYYLEGGLRQALALLASEPGLSAAQGRCAAFVVDDNGLQMGTFYNFLKGYAETSPAAAERLRRVTTCFPILSGFYYSATRTSAFKEAVRIAFARPYGSPYVSEVLFTLCLFIQGGMRTVDDLIWMRNLQTPPVSNAGWNRKVNICEWLPAPDRQDEVLAMLGELGAFYARFKGPQDSFGLPEFFNALLAFDQRQAAGEVTADAAIPFAAPVFLALARQVGLPVDASALRRAEQIELDDWTAGSAGLQARLRIANF